ncbi:Outer membrane receptor proteins, mostly Fe transport [Sphingomonas sp. NFR04]|nr:Outer membrane receptor proteins, mostly Fe transport [Sphingomonas sp. NFR04]
MRLSRSLFPIRMPLRACRLACGAAVVVVAPAQAQPQREALFDIPAQSLATALDSFARQAGVQILYPYRLAAPRHCAGVRGRMTARAALDRLLRNSGLAVARMSDRVVILRAAPARSTRPIPKPQARPKPAMPPEPLPPPEELVVTGRAAGTPLRDTALSYAVTPIDADTLARAGPRSTADLFRQIPGFWVESTGGEASNNVRSRGIPTDGYSSVALLEDGLPVQYDGGLGYLNTDQVFRADSTIDRVEAVRGGPSAVFMPNAPGGSVNFLTRSGLHRPGTTLSATLGSFGYQRIDGFAGAALAPHLGLSVGGFYRRDDGLRDPGYPADRGGQLRGAIEYDDGGVRLAFNVKHLDDRVILYLPVPLQAGADGAIRAIPGFDPLFDTLAGPQAVHVPMKTAAGTTDFDLSEGTHSRVTFYTFTARLALGQGLALESKARLRTGSTLRNGLFPIGRPMSGAAYLDGVRTQLVSAFPGTAATQIRYTGSSMPFLPDSNGNGLVVSANLLSVRMPMTEFVSDTRLTQRLDALGSHEAAVGLSYDHMRLGFDREMGSVLLDVRGRAQRLDVVALDGTGQLLGALTDNGFLRYGSLFDHVDLRASDVAIYGADEWKLSSRWRLDLGARWERTRIGGGVEGAVAVDLGDPATLADDAVLTGTGAITPIHRSFSGVSWTAGANFNPTPRSGMFARVSRIARLPSATEFNGNPNRADEAAVPIAMIEAGLLLRHRRWNLSAVAFRTHFTRLPFADYRFDPASYSYVERTSIADTTTRGLELDGHAELVGPVHLDVQATLQDPRYRNFRYVDLVDGAPVTFDVTGNHLIRVPKLAVRATPSLVLFGGDLRLASEIVHYSERFADIANTQRLPPFSLLNLHVDAQLSERLKLVVRITNLTNTLGLTEGNPRGGSFNADGRGSGYFFARPEFGRALRATIIVRP